MSYRLIGPERDQLPLECDPTAVRMAVVRCPGGHATLASAIMDDAPTPAPTSVWYILV